MPNVYNIPKNKLLMLIKQGLSIPKISDIFGCSTSLVFLYIKKYGISIHDVRMIGKKSGDLVVESFSHSNGKEKIWNCRCSCGKLKPIRATDINKQNIKSCGCWHARHSREKSKKFTGYGEIHGKVWGTIERGAKYRNYKFTITIEYAWGLFLKQNRKCALSGENIYFANNLSPNTDRATASLDRIDNNKGYIEGNVQWIHKDINYMKQHYSQQYFIQMCKKIATNLNKLEDKE